METMVKGSLEVESVLTEALERIDIEREEVNKALASLGGTHEFAPALRGTDNGLLKAQEILSELLHRNRGSKLS